MKLVIEEIPTDIMALPQSKASISFTHNGITHSSFVYFYGHDDSIAVQNHVEKLLIWKDNTVDMIEGRG